MAFLLVIAVALGLFGVLALVRWLARCLTVSAAVGFGVLAVLAAFVGALTAESTFGVVLLVICLPSAVLLFVAAVLRVVGLVSDFAGSAVTGLTGSKDLGKFARRATSIGAGIVIGGVISEAFGESFDEGDTPEEFESSSGQFPVSQVATSQQPNPADYGRPSSLDGDPRVHPVDGYDRTSPAGHREHVDPYWRGKRG